MVYANVNHFIMKFILIKELYFIVWKNAIQNAKFVVLIMILVTLVNLILTEMIFQIIVNVKLNLKKIHYKIN